VLIYLPSRVRLLLLSATISNAEEICEWLKNVRGTPNRVVRSAERPVPLEMLFLFHDGLIVPLAGKKGLSPEVKRFLASKAGGQRRRSGKINLGRIMMCLRAFDLLPAIFFLKSRSDCDRAILTCRPVNKAAETKDRLREATRKFLEDYPHLKRHRQMGPLLESMVASHHGGQLPYWKVLIEKMMNKGYLEAIFSTSTVAAGVNFPARAVILVQSDRYNGHEFIDLSATDLHQMIGRAGRRGKDQIGFAVVIPGLHQDPQLINRLKDSVPEPILSQIHINFSMTLNLLLSHSPLEVKDLLEHSFAVFQQRKSEAFFRTHWDEMLSHLKTILPAAKCDASDPYEVMENIQRMSELQREFKTLTQAIRYKRLANAYRKHLKPGRLFLHKNRSIYVVFQTYADQGRVMCAAHDVKKSVRTRKGRLRLSKVALNQIKAIFDYQVDLTENHSVEKLVRQFDSISLEDLKALNIETPDLDTGSKDSSAIKRRMSTLQCEGCEHQKTCHGARKGSLWKLLQDFLSLAIRMEGMHGGLWLSFKRHVRFLKETGFVDEMSRLTSDGYWASKLRLDQPLLIAEAIRKGAFDGVSPEILAGGLAPFVWDKAREMELSLKGAMAMTELEEMLNRILEHIEQIRSLKDRRGFESPPIMSWPAAAVFMWAKRVPWEKLLNFVHVDEGDLASLIMRTADHLRQVTNLRETHPDLAFVAEKGIELLLREPVYIH
jgi:superfamily II RNA helicase